jgi:O-antigen ligase
MNAIKGALAAPLFFGGLVFVAAGSVNASPLLWTCALALFIGAALLRRSDTPPGVTPLAGAVCAYAAWIAANDFINSPYTPAGIFHPAFLVAGFVLARRLDREARNAALKATLVGMALLASWALVQAASGQGRAHAHLETPNTLATVLNLALAPLLFRIAYGDQRRSVLGLAILLTAALVSTLSRGGFIALTGGLLAASLLYARRPTAGDLARLFVVVASGALIALPAMQLPVWMAPTAAPVEGPLESVSSTLGGTVGSRFELYRVALGAVGEHPWLGVGYLGFKALFDAGRLQVPSYAADNFTYFVHDDYLQTLVELGVPGFVLLLVMIALPFWLTRKAALAVMERNSLHATLAGVATMAIHALGDFPFYVPICLLLFGALLGEVDRLLPRRTDPAPVCGVPQRLAKIVGAAAVAILILPPPLAEAAAAYGERSWHRGNAESAAFGFELARRFQSRDWRYHWYAGQFWYAQAMQSGKREAANLADAAFAAAVHANGADPRPLLGRLATQLRFASVLEQRQSAATLRGWADRALALAPLNAAVRLDYAAAVAQLPAMP